MITAEKIIALAYGQLGVVENPAGSNKVIYNTDFYGREVSGPAYPWCCSHIWWLFWKLGASSLFCGGARVASCTAVMRYAKNNGLFVKSGFRRGDLILYNFDGNANDAEHIGICVGSDGSSVTCIEGNTSQTSDDNGGKVMLRSRSLKVVIGAYRPNYIQTTKKEEETVKVEVKVLKKGSSGAQVKSLQILLNGKGHSCGEVDGSFGKKTLAGVKSFQTANNLVPDGSVGPATWKKLLG